MTTTWGATSSHLRVGVDVSMSPATVTASTTQVTLTWKVSVQTVGWWFAEGQTATLSGAVAASKAYRKDDPKKTGTYDTVVGSWTSTVATSAAAPVTRQLQVKISTNASGATPSVAASFTVPQRPAPATPAPATPTDPATPVDPGKDKPVDTTGAATTSEYQVIASGAEVKTLPDPASLTLDTLAQGTRVSGTITAGWLQISSDTYTGEYIAASQVKLVAAATPDPTTPTTPDVPTSPGADVTPPPVAPASMDLVPATGALVWSSGDYDAFPYAAAHGRMVLTAWRHAVNHAIDRQATIMAALSTDAGRTYGTPWTIPMPAVANAAPSPAGLAWDDKGNQWVMLVGWIQYKSATDNAVASRWSQIMTSKDDGQTWSTPVTVATPGTSWWFSNALVIRDGVWIMAGYGALSGAASSSSWSCLTMVSTDRGVSWSAPAAVQGVPDGSSWGEPKITRTPADVWVMMMRRIDADEIHRAVSIDGSHWAYAGLAVAGYTGNPDVLALPDGTLILLARTPNVPSSSAVKYDLGFYAWGHSLDGGASWTMQSGFAGATGRNVYGSMALTTEGVAVVYAAEDDPDKGWGAASVWYSRFVSQQLVVQHGSVGPVAAIDISTADRIPVMRVWTDPWTGEERVEKVRWRSLDGYTSRDFEVQQGRTVTYRAGARVTGEVTAPILPHIILVHPLYPELSMPVKVATDAGRSYALDAQVTRIPGSPYAIATKSGARKVRSPEGETRFRTDTLVEKERILRLFEDGSPLFVSAHPGTDFPDWIQPLDFGDERVVQWCGNEARDWSFKWVAVRPPSAAALPVRRRIQDLDQTIQSLTLPIEEI